jgi:hypothetical protein
VHEEDQLFDLFVDKKCFAEYLEQLHQDAPELPEPLLLQVRFILIIFIIIKDLLE